MEDSLASAVGTFPQEWHICFRRTTTSRRADFFAFGRYKHVSCFGYVAGAGAWVFYDFGSTRTSIAVVPDRSANKTMGRFVDDCLVVKWVPPVVPHGLRIRPALLCTSAVARVTGVPSCALRPDRFLRDCLANGAEIVIADDELRQRTRDRPRIEAPAGSGAG